MSNSEPSQIKRIPRPEEIVAHLNEAIKGQSHIKRMIACAAYSHLLKCHSKLQTIRTAQSLENCLISGPTASGKTSMLQRVANYLKMPTVTVNTGSISPAGYKGKTCSDVLEQIEAAAVSNGVTHPTLCIWDEYDKCSFGGSNTTQSQLEAGVYKRMAQSDMLGILQGIRQSDRPDLDLSKVLHIACGAFAERPTANKSGIIGFHAGFQPFEEEQPQTSPSPEYFIQQGLMAELVGRFPRLGVMDKPDQVMIREIITESITSPYRQKLWFFQQHGTNLRFNDQAIDMLAQVVATHPTGVRALQLVLNHLLAEFEYEITRTDCKSIEEILFTQAAVAGTEEPLVIRSSTTKSGRIPVTSKPDQDPGDALAIY